jgi:molybdopterin converting factor subunit 1
MTLDVHLFARARDLAGAAVITIDLPAGATVADLRRALAAAHPGLAAILSHCAIAVNNDFAGDDRILSSPCEIALLPPVSGG